MEDAGESGDELRGALKSRDEQRRAVESGDELWTLMKVSICKLKQKRVLESGDEQWRALKRAETSC